ncbi:MAG: CAP domain-containing protein [Chloroflexi bacterium]|nr:MAG: CAP domain-containing protein [Chloroflexota bacterium]
MRFLSWIGGLLVAGTLAVGVVSAVHLHSASGHNLTASRQPASLFSANDPAVPDPPHKILPPSPSPDPPPPPPPPAPAPPARAAIVVGSTQQALINQDRAAYGLGPLTWSNCLYSVAVSNARRVAAQGSLSHTNGPSVDLTCGLGRQAGENVGWWSGGINDAKINGLFMASPEHKANILGPYRYVATAWVAGANGGYVAVEFS